MLKGWLAKAPKEPVGIRLGLWLAVAMVATILICINSNFSALPLVAQTHCIVVPVAQLRQRSVKINGNGCFRREHTIRLSSECSTTVLWTKNNCFIAPLLLSINTSLGCIWARSLYTFISHSVIVQSSPFNSFHWYTVCAHFCVYLAVSSISLSSQRVEGWVRMVDQQQQQQQQPKIWDQIGSSFVHHYYKMFDTDRGQLASLYVSMQLYCV